MSGVCDSAMAQVGGGVAAALGAVDCVSGQVTSQAFGRLFAPGGALETALVILLTLYVAFFGISLMLGRSNLGVRALVPRMLTVGLVLGFATSFVAYRSFVWPLFIEGPDYLATLLTGSDGSATLAFADKLDVVFLAVQEASKGQEDISAFSPPGMMWLGALLLMLGTVGVLVTARIGLALLVALGPIFVVMALFNGTRGLFTGWLKGVAMLALTPLLAVLGGSVMLELAVPVLASLSAVPGQIDAQAAMAFFLIGAVHCALMVMVIKVAATMVSGWRVFGLVPDRDRAGSADSVPQPRTVEMRSQAQAQAGAGASTTARRIDVSAVQTGSPANDSGGGGGTIRETKVYATSHGDGRIQPLNPATSRTRGIGNRFRSANARLSEKMK
ncbi:type IV secretion system protein [Altererythrobacter sp.]|uniref:type IV secretion system protein n=1 Tax=Altererythrobacter sp. TaxID=1872480 RepID=UPI003CFC27EE